MRTQVTTLIAPLLWADYLRCGDTRGLTHSDIASADRLLAYEPIGEVYDVEPMPKHMHTRSDPPLARYSFVRVEEPSRGH